MFTIAMMMACAVLEPDKPMRCFSMTIREPEHFKTAEKCEEAANEHMERVREIIEQAGAKPIYGEAHCRKVYGLSGA